MFGLMPGARVRWSALALAALLVGVAGCRTPPPPAVAAEPTWPILLVHGMAGSPVMPMVGEYFGDVRPALAAEGHSVFTPALSAYADTETRSAQLAAAVDEALRLTGARRVHIIAHSQAGLDARYLVEVKGYADRIGSLTTVATPHRGTPVADTFRPLPGPLLDLALSVANTFQRAEFAIVDGNGAVEVLSQLNSPDDPGEYPVPAFSFAGVTGRPRDGACDGGAWGDYTGSAAAQAWLLPLSAAVSSSQRGQWRSNDGLVPVDSARWQHFLGCLPGDHLAVVGMTWTHPEGEGATPFDPVSFYRAYARALRMVEKTGRADLLVANPPPQALRWTRLRSPHVGAPGGGR